MLARIFSAIVHEYSNGRRADPITLRPYFVGDAAMTELGGPGFLAQLTGSGAVALGWRDCAEQIKSLARRRRLVASLEGVIAESEDWNTPIATLIDAADSALVDATEQGGAIHQPTAGECIGEVLDSFEVGHSVGVSSGISVLDSAMGTLRPKQLVVLASRPGMGKTATALSYALGAAQRGHGVLFVSLEMSSTELGARMASDLSFDSADRVPYADIIEGRVSVNQKRTIARAMLTANDLPIHVVDLGSVTIGRLSMIVRRHARRFAAAGQKLEMVIVDYLQLVRADHMMKSAYETVSEVSRGLKAMAKEHGVGVMALAQLSREVEKRPDHRPMLSDLRDSGQIEQDADAVVFLLRPEYYLRREEPSASDAGRHDEWEAELSGAQGRIEFHVAKRRNGPEGRAEGIFYGAYQAVRG